MKTAREIIARHLAANTALWPRFVHDADAILAALAAEGFSIVETGRDPVQDMLTDEEIDAARATLRMHNAAALEIRRRRSTSEGKTEPAVDSGDIGHG